MPLALPVKRESRLAAECLWHYTVGMATKPAPERTYTEPFQVRVTPAQLDLFRKAAEADGRSVSNWARERLERAAVKELKAKG